MRLFASCGWHTYVVIVDYRWFIVESWTELYSRCITQHDLFIKSASTTVFCNFFFNPQIVKPTVFTWSSVRSPLHNPDRLKNCYVQYNCCVQYNCAPSRAKQFSILSTSTVSFLIPVSFWPYSSLLASTSTPCTGSNWLSLRLSTTFLAAQSVREPFDWHINFVFLILLIVLSSYRMTLKMHLFSPPTYSRTCVTSLVLGFWLTLSLPLASKRCLQLCCVSMTCFLSMSDTLFLASQMSMSRLHNM